MNEVSNRFVGLSLCQNEVFGHCEWVVGHGNSLVWGGRKAGQLFVLLTIRSSIRGAHEK